MSLTGDIPCVDQLEYTNQTVFSRKTSMLSITPYLPLWLHVKRGGVSSMGLNMNTSAQASNRVT